MVRWNYKTLRSLMNVALIAGMALFAHPYPLHAAQITMYDNAGASITMPVTSLMESRFERTTRQQFDFSCGSAALATLLTYHYDWPVSEKIVLGEMYEVGDKEKIIREGFSLLDMKKYLQSVGFEADGYRQSLDALQKIGVPAMALINYNGYKHFVVIKGVRDDRVLVGDSALGTRMMKRSEFEEMWNGILFVIRDDIALGQSHFNMAADWKISSKPPIEAALLQDGLSRFTIDIKPTNFY